MYIIWFLCSVCLWGLFETILHGKCFHITFPLKTHPLIDKHIITCHTHPTPPVSLASCHRREMLKNCIMYPVICYNVWCSASRFNPNHLGQHLRHWLRQSDNPSHLAAVLSDSISNTKTKNICPSLFFVLPFSPSVPPFSVYHNHFQMEKVHSVSHQDSCVHSWGSTDKSADVKRWTWCISKRFNQYFNVRLYFLLNM